MILKTLQGYDSKAIVVTNAPTQINISDTINDIDWLQFSSVTLFQDDENWLSGSGCATPGFGLSVMLSLDGIQYVTEKAPEEPKDMLELFYAYLNREYKQLFALIYDAKNRDLNEVDVEQLRRKEEEIQRQDANQEIFKAVGLGNLATVKSYADKGGNLNITNDSDMPILCIAAHWGHHFVVTELLERKAYIETVDKQHYTPLLHAASTGMEKCIEVLLKYGAAKDALTLNGENALMLCAKDGSIEATELLVENNFDVNFCDCDGYTPLMYAAMNFNDGVEIANFLISKGAVKDAVNKDGETMLDIAIERDNDFFVKNFVSQQ